MQKNINKILEIIIFSLIYLFLFAHAIIKNDSLPAFISAFCGITYTILAGKGKPICYPIGAIGSSFYVYLSFLSNLWGNLVLYACYYIPMQIIGFFQWNRHLKNDSYEVVKIRLNQKEKFILYTMTILISLVSIKVLSLLGDKNPIMDGITTIFSILAMYLTVKRCIEQWTIWMIVNFLSLIMWLDIALSGARVSSTVFMWFVYFMLAIYFYYTWHKDLNAGYNK